MSAAILSCPGPAALPIIFVPGIMGSRLRNRRTGRVVWDPDNYSDWSDIIPGTSGNGSIARQMRSGAGGKRRSLVAPPGSPYTPDYLEVDPGRAGRNRLTEETVARGWGGVHQASYRSILMWLRYTASNGFSGVLPKSCTSLRYEVWAHPYNWTADNALSGQQLGQTVTRAIRETTAKYAGTGIKVLKPVIITHSMGGFVSRAYTHLHGGAGIVHGVIHGAMPTDGAPATYKRMVAGFEGVSRFALGANQIEVTATAGNCPGPLGLLPNKVHRGAQGQRPWLSAAGRSGSALWSRPAANPYAEIYTNRTEWWRLIDAAHLDPEGDPTGRSSWARYLTQLTKAAQYHERLGGGGFHANTRMFWSGDGGHAAWDRIEWHQTARQDTPPQGRQHFNDNRGTMQWGEWYYPTTPYGGGGMPQFLADCRYVIRAPSAPGDGTVHTGSGRYVNGPMSVRTSVGFEHQYAFDPAEIRKLVATWLVEMVAEQL